MDFKLDIDITNNTGEIKAEVVQKLLRGLRAVGAEAVGLAAEDCPVDTGLLRNSLAYGLAGEQPQTARGGHDYSDDSASQKAGYSGKLPSSKQDELTLYVGSNVEYAPYVELMDYEHTSGKAHFLRDAIQDNLDYFKEILEASLRA